MLVDFSVENYGPFRNRVTLSMQATHRKEHMENVIDCGSDSIPLLSSALIFGANASGKSYIFKAVRALQRIVDDAYASDVKYPWYEPFKLDREHAGAPVSFRIRFLEDGVLYDYSISYLSDRIVSENLIYSPMKRPRTVFERRESVEDFKGKNRRLLSLLTPTTSFLALGSKYNDELCSKVRMLIKGIITLESQNIEALPLRSCEYVKGNPVKTEMLIEGLRKSDFGIVGYEVEEHIVDADRARKIIPVDAYEKLLSDNNGLLTASRISVKHSFGDPGQGGFEAVFDMDREESVGTRYMFGIMGPLVDSLENGKVLMIDEFGSHLHPLLTRWIVEQYSRGGNPNMAQLVAVTHDVGLIDTRELIRRDQAFFTDRNRNDGSATLYCLVDFKATRKDDQVLKAYLQGRYDAIPLVSSRRVMDVETE